MGILDDDLDDPTPTPLATETKKTRPDLKRRLPLKADLEVDRKKYKGERVSRADADIAEVEDFGVIINESAEDEDIDESSDGEEDFGIDELMAENNAKQDVHEDEEISDAIANVNENDEEADDSDAEMRKQELAIKERLAGEKERELKRAAAVKEQKVSQTIHTQFAFLL